MAVKKYLAAKFISTRKFINSLALVLGLALDGQLLVQARVGANIKYRTLAGASKDDLRRVFNALPILLTTR